VFIEPNKLLRVEGGKLYRRKELVSLEWNVRSGMRAVWGEGRAFREVCLLKAASQSCPNCSSRLVLFNSVYDDQFCVFLVYKRNCRWTPVLMERGAPSERSRC
jgi:hypothetical protein